MEGFKAEIKHVYKILLVGCFLAVVLITLYWPVWNYDFVNYDDDSYIYENAWVRTGLTSEGLYQAFSGFHAGNWHPLTWMTHMLDVEIHQLHAGGHHWTSVLTHMAGTILLFLVLSAMTRSLWPSALTAALFALHPLHVESVAWVAERKDVLSGFFWFLTMGAYSYYVRSPNVSRYVLVVISFTLGLLSKPMVVTLPFVLLLLDYWPLGRFDGTRTAFDRWLCRDEETCPSTSLRIVLEKAPMLSLTIVSCAVTLIAQRSAGAVAPLEVISLDVRVATALVSSMDYMGKMLWPADLAVLYPHTGMPPAWKISCAAVILFSISCLVVRKAREMPFLLVGWLWYLGTLIPVIGLVQVGSQSMADRYTYLPLVGLFIAVSWGVKSIVIKKPAWKKIAAAVVLFLLTGLIPVARAQVKTWENSVILFEHALAVTKVNPIALNNIGAYYLERGDCKKAVPYFRGALSIKSDYADVFHNLGVCVFRDNDSERAIQYLQQAIRINPRFVRARADLGFMLLQGGRLEDAREEYQQVLRIDPVHEVAHHHIGAIYLYQGKIPEAEHELRQTLRINPGSAEAHNNLGLLLMKRGRSDEAIDHFRQALALAPDNRAVEVNLRNALADTAE